MDGNENSMLLKRFGIEKYPTVLLFSRGIMYGPYNGEKDVESLTKWAEGGYLVDGTLSREAPQQEGVTDKLKENMGSILTIAAKVWDRDPLMFVLALVGGMTLGMLPMMYLVGLTLSDIKALFTGNTTNMFAHGVVNPMNMQPQPEEEKKDEKEKKNQ